jgi:hypothetical protein
MDLMYTHLFFRRRALNILILVPRRQLPDERPNLMEIRIFRDVLHFFQQNEIGGAATLGAGWEHIVFTHPDLGSIGTTFMFRTPYSRNGDSLPTAEGDLLNFAAEFLF